MKTNIKTIATRSGTAVLFALMLAACSSGVKLDKPPPVEDRGGAPAADPRAVQSVDVSGDPLNDPKSPLSQRSIYFDFDSFVVKEEYRPTIEAHARYLLSRNDRKISIEGHADERGSREYNLALGQKRSEAVRQQLRLLGVGEDRMEAVSFGEEKPKAMGQSEEAWAQNRRADIMYK